MATSDERWKGGKWPMCVCLLGLTSGCLGQATETERQLATLNERLLILQNDRDRLVERVDALESHWSKARVTDAAEVEAPHSSSRPPLKVVRLEPAHPTETEVDADELGRDVAAPEDVSLMPPDEQTSAVEAKASQRRTNASPSAAAPASAGPKLVLYGEGSTSGVHSSSEGGDKR